MIFHYQDHTFRIGFRHDKSRRWLDHAKHMLVFERQKDKRLAEHGPAVLWCMNCHLQLSHLSKDQLRRNTHCTIWQQNGVDGEGHPVWVELAQASSKLNVKAGDQYDREKGRVAALAAALTGIPREEAGYVGFRAALWHWFLNGRQRSALVRAQSKGA